MDKAAFQELSEKDREILFQLSLNGRISLTALAEKMNMSKQVVSYRVKQLEERQIIKRYYAITNVYRLGKAHYRIFIKYRNMSSEKAREFREYLICHPQIAWVLYLDGDFDIFFVVWADNVISFEAVYDDIIGKFGGYFQEKYFSIATRIEYLPYHFLLDNGPRHMESFVFGEVFSRYEPDRLESEILTVLNSNGRMYASELAQRFGVNAGLIKKKINGLMDLKIIMGFNVKIDHNLLGYTYRKILLKLNDTSRMQLESLSQYLKQKKNVVFLLKTIGTYDFEIELMTRTTGEFYGLIEALRQDFSHNVSDYSSVVMREEPKYEHLTL